MARWLMNPFKLSNTIGENARAHLTFRQSSLGRTAKRAGRLLKQQLWVWPIIAVVVLATIGYLVSGTINRIMVNSLQSELATLLSVEKAMLLKWFKVQESNALRLASESQIRTTINQILTSTKSGLATPNNQAPGATPNTDLLALHSQLQDQLATSMTANNFVGYIVADRHLQIVSAQTPELLGKNVPEFEASLTSALEGQTIVSPPFPSIVTLKDRTGKERTGVPTMLVCAPVRDERLQVVAVLGLRIRPEREFTEILQLGRIGASGETYAVNRQGLMVSNSRFDEKLIMLGVLPDEPGAASILKVQIRDPGGDLNAGFRPVVRRSEMPFTAVFTRLQSGSNGVLMNNYRNYRGASSIGAYAWIPEYQVGIITEIESEEAFLPLTILRRTFYGLYALLTVSAIAIFAFTLIVARLKRQAQKAEIEAKQLGQYRLEKKLGEGAMGVVYKGFHAMLRRPTAIKLLPVDKVDQAAITRFEREVQITCKLNHPSTIAIFDYGRTPEGVFYYAMEFLDGIDLQSLVDRYGPLPEDRVVHILKQICGSLFEAHSLGLVHRDVKPANVMLNRRACEPDVVKVLDFGLVKDIDEGKSGNEQGLSGTPLYMSPESIQTPEGVDGRSDLYSLGAVAYFLLTGQTVFQAKSLGELCQQHIASLPAAIASRTGRVVSPGLENAVMSCLEKSRARRPQTARQLCQLLEAIPAAGDWTKEQADVWWRAFERGQMADGVPTPSTELASSQKRGNPTNAGSSQKATSSDSLAQTIEDHSGPKA